MASPVLAQDFPYRGQWEARLPDQSYVALILIDSEGRATWDSPNDGGRPAKFFGYMERQGADAIIVLTNKAAVNKTYCENRARELMHCYTVRASGSRSENFLLVKVGPGPEHLTPSPSRN